MSTDSTFRLTEEPWIPAENFRGDVADVSLLELFQQAHRLRDFAPELPTMRFALMRLALAVLYAALRGPADVEAWRRLWEREVLPAEAIRAYLEHDVARERFDLLHPRTPFYQVASLRTSKSEMSSLERLIADVPTGEPFVSARSGKALERIRLAEAARWVVHAQAFDVSGIKSGAVGDPRVKNGKGYPIGVGFCGHLGGVFAEGRNLRETLLLNLIPLNRWEDLDHDQPVWERDPELTQTPAEESVPSSVLLARPYGPMDLLTWQARRIRLRVEDGSATGVLVCNGDKLDPHNMQRLEPFTAWRRSLPQEKKLRRAPVYLPRTHDPARSVWRGLEVLLPKRTVGSSKEAPKSLAPLLMEWLRQAAETDSVDESRRFRLRTVGAQYGTQNSVVDEVVDDTVTVTAGVVLDVDERRLRRTLLDALACADRGASAFADLAADLAAASGADVKETVKDLREAARADAYDRLDRPFRTWLAGLDGSTDPIDAFEQWQRTADRLLRDLGQELIHQAGSVAWIGREIDKRTLDSSLAQAWFLGRLRKALPATSRPADGDEPIKEDRQ